jgi:hypothetical protein
LTLSAMSRKLCSNRAALLAYTHSTHVSGDASRVRYACSMASCDLLHDSQRSILPRLYLAYPTPPRPTSAVHEPGAVHLSCRSSSIVPRSTKSLSRANGMAINGCGGVSGRAAAGLRLALARTLRTLGPCLTYQ